MAGLFSLGRTVLEPPPEFQSGPTLSGRTKEIDFDDLDALNAWCKAQGVGLDPHAGPGAYYQACYSIPADTVALPTRKAWPSQAEIDELREHEYAHARGWQHPGEQRAPLTLDRMNALAAAIRQSGTATASASPAAPP